MLLGAPPQLAAKEDGDQSTFPIASRQVRSLLSEHSAGYTFERVHQMRHRKLGRILDEQVDVVILAIHLDKFCRRRRSSSNNPGYQRQDASAEILPGKKRARFRMTSWVHRLLIQRLPKFSGSTVGSPRLSLMRTVDWPVSSKRLRHL